MIKRALLAGGLLLAVESQTNQTNQRYCGPLANLTISNYDGCSCANAYSYYKHLTGPGLDYYFQISSDSSSEFICTQWTASTTPQDRVDCVNGSLVVTVNVYHTSNISGSPPCPAPENLHVFPTGDFCSLNDGNGCGGAFVEQTHDTGIACGVPCNNNNKCAPHPTLTQHQCKSRIRFCKKIGAYMKWTGKGCRQTTSPKILSDGGCQCKGYCGHLCKQSCTKDRECYWQPDGCYKKSDHTKGSPITQCAPH